MANDEPYRFKGVRLKPSGARKLIIELFAGKLVERSEMIAFTYRHHRNMGGAETPARRLVHTFKRALTSLKSAGLAENPSLGDWRIHGGDVASVQINDLIDIADAAEDDTDGREAWGDKDIGSGTKAIYVYYLPAYRRLAELRGHTEWPCKIGRTDHDPLYRILSQLATAFPEPPTIALILRTDDSQMLETAIHLALTGRGKAIQDAPGEEWFLTNPDHVEDIAKFLRPDLFVQKLVG